MESSAMKVLRSSRWRVWLLVWAGLLSGCASRQSTPSLYVALGELEGIGRLVDALIDAYRGDARINSLFQSTDFDYFKARLVEDICVKANGPCEYQGLDMVEAHSGMNISEAEFNWFVEDSRAAMTLIGLPVGTQNRLLAILARERADVIRQ